MRENDKPLPDGSMQSSYQQQFKHVAIADKDVMGTGDPHARTPIPRRPSADAITWPSSSASSSDLASTGGLLSTPKSHVSEQANSMEHASVDISASLDLLKPSSPLSELPQSQSFGMRDETEEDIDQHSQGEPERDARAECAFAKVLNSVIQAGESKDEEYRDEEISALIADNRFKAPVTLPLAVARVAEAGSRDYIEVEEFTLTNYELLESFLMEGFASRDKRRGESIFRLRHTYKELNNEWQIHCNKLEKIRSRQKRRQTAQIPPLTPSLDPFALNNAPATPGILAASGRANRRNAANTLGYGDAARSEAEFLEILASLEDADMRDPNLRAMRTTATVPDMFIDSGEVDAVQAFNDKNGFVVDPLDHYGVIKKPDVWTEEEIATFCRRYALFPKQFGRIGAALPDKTTAQCVLFYYRSKKKIDFRALVDKRSRDGKRKRKKDSGEKGEEEAGANGKKKGTSLLANLKRSKDDEMEEEDDDDEPQTPGSAIVADSAKVIPSARALTDQLNGQKEDQSLSKLLLGGDLEGLSDTSTSSRLYSARSENRKAARFLSPSQIEDSAEDGMAPPSDGVLAAASALGVLGALSNTGSRASYQQQLQRQKKRKPSISEQMYDAPYGVHETPSGVFPAKRAKPHSSSYWSVADKNEFVRLLALHGKNYFAIADGIDSKTAVQCKNVRSGYPPLST